MMSLRHKRTVRAYFLGTLPENQAEALEMRYFTDRAFLRKVKQEEDRLIRDYLAGRLDPAGTALFEKRYLNVPLLRRRLDEMRSTPSPRSAWRFAAASGLIVIAGTGLWIGNRISRYHVPNAVDSSPLLVTLIKLSPGVLKGQANQHDFPQPGDGASVVLQLELLRSEQPVSCAATLNRVAGGGQWDRVWSGTARMRSPGSISAEIPGTVFTEGDYVAQINCPDGAHDSYVMRIVRGLGR